MHVKKLTATGSLAGSAFTRKWTTAALDHLTCRACRCNQKLGFVAHLLIMALKVVKTVAGHTFMWPKYQVPGILKVAPHADAFGGLAV